MASPPTGSRIRIALSWGGAPNDIARPETGPNNRDARRSSECDKPLFWKYWSAGRSPRVRAGPVHSAATQEYRVLLKELESGKAAWELNVSMRLRLNDRNGPDDYIVGRVFSPKERPGGWRSYLF